MARTRSSAPSCSRASSTSARAASSRRRRRTSSSSPATSTRIRPLGLDTTNTGIRVFPLIAVSKEEIESIVGDSIVGMDLVEGGLTNTIHKVTLASGASLGIKHYAGGREWFETELATLTLL